MRTPHFLKLLFFAAFQTPSLQRGAVKVDRPSGGDEFKSETTVAKCYLSAGGLEPSVAQPPLPLQEFLPLQPLSLALQPPLPLHEFWPLQACFSFTVFWSWD